MLALACQPNDVQVGLIDPNNNQAMVGQGASFSLRRGQSAQLYVQVTDILATSGGNQMSGVEVEVTAAPRANPNRTQPLVAVSGVSALLSPSTIITGDGTQPVLTLTAGASATSGGFQVCATEEIPGGVEGCIAIEIVVE